MNLVLIKKITLLALFVVFSLVLVNSVDAYVNVKGYTKKDGTYVAPYVRSNPNGLKSDNYGYTPSQGTYNKTYGTRGSSWDTPTSITDPYYYQGKSIYESGNSTYTYPSYNSYNPSYITTPSCPTNSYYDGISSCKCNYGYVVSGGSCISANSLCYTKLGYSSSYDSISNTCKCDSGYVIGTSGQCVSASSYCSNQIGSMSQYNSLTNKCECMYGYEFNGSSCVYKTKSYSNTSAYSTNSYNCPLNSHVSSSDSTKCQCDSGYQVNSTKTACTAISYAQPTYTPQPQSDDIVGKNYYLTNRTCIGLSGKQFGECVSYAYNH